jgi:hypothetical protein
MLTLIRHPASKISVANFMQFYNQIFTNEAELSEIHFSSRHSADLDTYFIHGNWEVEN